jgi:hypothetical protein
MKRQTELLVAIGLLAAVALACGDSNTGSKVGTAAAPAATAKAQIYAVGDVVQVQDHTITLNSATLTDSALKANFTIENKGTKDVAVSSIMSFSARNSEGTKLDQEYGCGASMDGKVMPGDKLKGDICWNGAVKPIKIYYEANFLSSGAVVWEVK